MREIGQRVRRAFRAGRDDDRRNGSGVAGLVEVLQIECVIANLIESERRELVFAYLKLKNEDHRVDERKDVDALAEARNRILEVERTVVPIWSKRGFKNRDFFKPRICLG